MLLPVILFYLFSFITIVSSLVVVSGKNPVHAVLFMILAFFNVAGLFILIKAEFLAMLLVIVYVGAVAILFLFIVMMLDVDFEAMRLGFKKHLPIGITIAVVFLLELVLIIKASSIAVGQEYFAFSFPIDANSKYTNTEMIGNILYTDFFLPFQISGLILLVAIIGAIVLTLRKRAYSKKQSIVEQVTRKREDSIALIDIKIDKK